MTSPFSRINQRCLNENSGIEQFLNAKKNLITLHSAYVNVTVGYNILSIFEGLSVKKGSFLIINQNDSIVSVIIKRN